MATYKTGAETVPLGREMDGDKGKDIDWDAVYGNEGVPPFADSCQRCGGISGELRNVIKGEPVEEVSVSFLKSSRTRLQ